MSRYPNKPTIRGSPQVARSKALEYVFCRGLGDPSSGAMRVFGHEYYCSAPSSLAFLGLIWSVALLELHAYHFVSEPQDMWWLVRQAHATACFKAGNDEPAPLRLLRPNASRLGPKTVIYSQAEGVGGQYGVVLHVSFASRASRPGGVAD